MSPYPRSAVLAAFAMASMGACATHATAVHPTTEPTMTSLSSRVQQAFGAYFQGDALPLRRLMRPDVTLVSAGTSRLAGEHRGPDAVLGFGSLVSAATANSFKTAPEFFAENGPTVAILLRDEATVRGKPFEWFEAIIQRYDETSHLQRIELFHSRQAEWDAAFPGAKPEPLSAAWSATARNIENARAGFAAYFTGDPSKMVALLADDASITMPGKNRFSGTRTGKAEVLGIGGAIFEATGGTFQATPRFFAGNGDRVLIVMDDKAVLDGRAIAWSEIIVQQFDASGHIRHIDTYFSDQAAWDGFFPIR